MLIQPRCAQAYADLCLPYRNYPRTLRTRLILSLQPEFDKVLSTRPVRAPSDCRRHLRWHERRRALGRLHRRDSKAHRQPAWTGDLFKRGIEPSVGKYIILLACTHVNKLTIDNGPVSSFKSAFPPVSPTGPRDAGNQ